MGSFHRFAIASLNWPAQLRRFFRDGKKWEVLGNFQRHTLPIFKEQPSARALRLPPPHVLRRYAFRNRGAQHLARDPHWRTGIEDNSRGINHIRFAARCAAGDQRRNLPRLVAFSGSIAAE